MYIAYNRQTGIGGFAHAFLLCIWMSNEQKTPKYSCRQKLTPHIHIHGTSMWQKSKKPSPKRSNAHSSVHHTIPFQVPTTTMCDTISSMATAIQNEKKRINILNEKKQRSSADEEERKGTEWDGMNGTNVIRRNSVIKWSIFIAWLNMDLVWCQFANGCSKEIFARAKKSQTHKTNQKYRITVVQQQKKNTGTKRNGTTAFVKRKKKQ